MSKRAVKTLFEGKKQRLKRTLDWIEKHCTKQQKTEVNQIIDQYADLLVAYPNTDFLRCSHEIDDEIIKTPPTEEEVQVIPISKAEEQLDKEIKNRRKLINGLIMEIEELKQQQNQL